MIPVAIAEMGGINAVRETRGQTLPREATGFRMCEQPGIFEVVEVHMLPQTADLKLTDGTGHVTRNVSWTSLTYQRAA
jgi:hypothetical protein